MAAIRMFVARFRREVLIDEDHPLAVAQLQQNASAVVPADQRSEHTADTLSENAPLESAAPAATVVPTSAEPPRRRRSR